MKPDCACGCPLQLLCHCAVQLQLFKVWPSLAFNVTVTRWQLQQPKLPWLKHRCVHNQLEDIPAKQPNPTLYITIRVYI
jgi:hypothetical protein